MVSGRDLQARMEANAVAKASMPPVRALVLAMLAGAFIGLGASFMLVVKSDSTLSFAASSLLGGLCFCLGLFLILVAGGELFTGNCLMVQGVLSGRYSLATLFKSWGVVYAGNALGALVVVGLLWAGGFLTLNGGAVGTTAFSVASTKASLGVGTAFFRAILCNILVCLAVWIGAAGETVCDKLAVTLLPVAGFVAMGFEHSIANWYFLPLGLVAEASGYGEGLALAGVVCNLVVVTLGNIVGGALIGAAYWFVYHPQQGRRLRTSELVRSLLDPELDAQEARRATKKALRKQVSRERSGLDAHLRAEADDAIYQHLVGLEAYRDADVVYTYLSIGSEVGTRRLIEDTWAAGKVVALPRVSEGDHAMRWYSVSSLDDLERSALGLEEPAVDPARELDPTAVEDAIALVPGLAFDAEGYRLGYGGGYYDAFLATFPGRSVGLCRAAQTIPSLREQGLLEPYDRPVDLVVSEQGVVGGASRQSL